MRKDVKLGLAIGAIFLAVVIVWAAVPKKAKNTGVVLNKPVPQSVQPTNSQANAIPDQPQPAPAPHTVAPLPSGDSVATSGGPAAQAPKPADKPATDWATLLRASDEQLPALIGASRVAAETPDHPTASADQGASSDTSPETTHSHGGMLTDFSGLGDSTTRPAADLSTARTHTVQSGETFASIAKSVYGKSNMYLAIEKANPSINPNRLKVGTVLKLPSRADAMPAASSDSSTTVGSTHRTRASSPIDSATEYRVQPGDSLHKIAMKLYGNAARADELYTTNKAVIGDDPAKLKVGEVLKLPEPPTASVSR